MIALFVMNFAHLAHPLTRPERPADVVDMLDYARRRLSNGLRVIVVPIPHLHAVSLSMHVRSGPRYERGNTNGLSHLVEHLLFRGTISRPSSFLFNAAVEALGGEANGLTHRDATTIHMTFPPSTATAGLTLLGELCASPALGGLDIERGVVIEEIIDTTDGDGQELDADTISRTVLWADHPIGLPITGSVENVERFSDADCRAHYESTFVAENSVLCIAGPVDEAKILAVAEDAFGRLPRGSRQVDGPPPVVPRELPVHVQWNDDSQVTVLLSFPAPHENDPDFAALVMLQRVLDDGLACRLRQDISESRGLAYSVSASMDVYADVGAFDVEAITSPGKLITTFHQMLATVGRLVTEPVGERELERVKIRHDAELDFALDDPNEIGTWFGTAELVGCQASWTERKREALAVTSDDLLRVARRVFEPSQALVTLVGPVEPEAAEDIERLLGRAPGSTLWIENEDEDEPTTQLPLALVG